MAVNDVRRPVQLPAKFQGGMRQQCKAECFGISTAINCAAGKKIWRIELIDLRPRIFAAAKDLICWICSVQRYRRYSTGSESIKLHSGCRITRPLKSTVSGYDHPDVVTRRRESIAETGNHIGKPTGFRNRCVLGGDHQNAQGIHTSKSSLIRAAEKSRPR